MTLEYGIEVEKAKLLELISRVKAVPCEFTSRENLFEN